MRPALAMSCREGNDAPAYVIAMLLYCLGLDATPQPQAVDRQLGRKPGGIMEPLRDLFLLLDRGLQVCLVGEEVEDSSEELFRDGIVYIEKLIKELGLPWDENVRALWTPERVAALQEREREYRRRRDGVNKYQFSEVTSQLTQKLLDRFLDEGCAIQVTIWHNLGGRGTSGSIALVYGRKGGMYYVYDAARGAPRKAYAWKTLSRVISVKECRVWSVP